MKNQSPEKPDSNASQNAPEQAKPQTDGPAPTAENVENSEDASPATRQEQATPPQHQPEHAAEHSSRPELLTGPRSVRAVLERWEEGSEETLYAVLLVGDDEKEVIMPAHRLPSGTQEGTWLALEMEGERVVSLALDPGTTAARRATVQAKRSMLKRRGRKLSPRNK